MVIFGFCGVQFFFLSASSLSETFTFILLFGISTSTMSPFLTSAIGPPRAASGLT